MQETWLFQLLWSSLFDEMCRVAMAGLRAQKFNAFTDTGCFIPLRYLIQGLVLEIAITHHIYHL